MRATYHVRKEHIWLIFLAQHNPMLHLAHSRCVSKFVQYTHLTLSQSYGATGSALELTPFTAIYCAPDPDSVNTAEKIAEVRSDSLYIRACLEYQKQDDQTNPSCVCSKIDTSPKPCPLAVTYFKMHRFLRVLLLWMLVGMQLTWTLHRIFALTQQRKGSMLSMFAQRGLFIHLSSRIYKNRLNNLCIWLSY